MSDNAGPETEEGEGSDNERQAEVQEKKARSVEKVVVGRYTALLRELKSLGNTESITVVHYITEWTEQGTGSIRTRSELDTVLENHSNISKYIKGEFSSAEIFQLIVWRVRT